MNNIEQFESLDFQQLEKRMNELEQVEPKITHNFSDGVYVREMFAPKDTILLGKRHRYETCNILLKGKMILHMGDGLPNKIIEAPMVFNSKPGVRKLAYTLEDTIFLNVHPTKETDLEKIEAEFIVSEKEYRQLQGGKKCLG